MARMIREHRFEGAIVSVSLALLAACGSQGDTSGSGGSSGTHSGGASGASGSGSGGSSGSSSGGSSGSATGGSSGSGTGGSSGSGNGGSSGTAGGGGANSSPDASAGSGGTKSGDASVGTGGAGGSSGSAGSSGAAGGDASTGRDGSSSGSGGSGVDAGPAVACQAPIAAQGTAVAVAVDLATVRATVGTDLMGIHTSVYDGHMTATTTPALLKAAGVKSLRYPGGSYADEYHWATHTATPFGVGTDRAGDPPYVDTKTGFGAFIGVMEAAGASALITVNYGTNPAGDGPGLPEEAAAWVAYANALPTSTVAIGTAGGIDWKTAGDWAKLRGAAKLDVDDGKNFLRISHPDPVGIKLWEVGNELYGNGFYYTGGGWWEEDLHLAHNIMPRQYNAALSPVKYGQEFPRWARAMKAVDPTIKVGAILHWPYTEYTSPADWNNSVLNADTCAAIDFGVNHWYAGSSLTDLLTRARTDIPSMFTQLGAKFKERCTGRTDALPLAVTEWGPNFLNFEIKPPAQTQIIGLFGLDAYANYMEQHALTLDWLELHNERYLGGGDTDVPMDGYHAQQMAHYLADVGDSLVTATVGTLPAAFTGGLIQAHASRHVDGSVSVLLVNTSPTAKAAVQVTVSGASTTLGCVGTSYTYAPVSTDQDGPVVSAPIFAMNNGVPVTVPAYSAVVVVFPKM